MFDDKKFQSAPENSGPEDILADVDNKNFAPVNLPEKGQENRVNQINASQPNSLPDKNNRSINNQANPFLDSDNLSFSRENYLPPKKNGGILKKVLIILVTIFLIATIILLGLMIYQKFQISKQLNLENNNFFSDDSNPLETEEENNFEEEAKEEDEISNESTFDKDLSSDEEIVNPETIPSESEKNAKLDSDNDGLIDVEEIKLGTDPYQVDSDNDGLFDREEVVIYETDPLKTDTDGDSWKDGDEVRTGYSPTGPGKLQ